MCLEYGQFAAWRAYKLHTCKNKSVWVASFYGLSTSTLIPLWDLIIIHGQSPAVFMILD